jgi:tetratricopeptide (TPR) repeat protein
MNDQMTGSKMPGKKKRRASYIPWMMPIGGIIILLALLIPQLVDKRYEYRGLAGVEPPLALKRYETGYATTDSLLNTALRMFSQKDYADAARLLSKVNFYWTVRIREGKKLSYPEDLRFYLGLAEAYRGHPEIGAPYLEEEERANPYEQKYPWYLAHVYMALGRYADARAELEKVVRLEGSLAPEAGRTMRELPGKSDSPGRG